MTLVETGTLTGHICKRGVPISESSVSIMCWYQMGCLVSIRDQCRDFSPRHQVQTDPGATEPPILWVSRAHYPGIKGLERES